MLHNSRPDLPRERTDLLDIASRLGSRLKRVSTSEFAGPCPRCGGRDRFSVNVKKSVWHCRGCGLGGDAIALVRQVLKLDFPAAVDWLGGKVALPTCAVVPSSPPAPDRDKIGAALAMWRAGRDPRGAIAERYLNTRGLGIDATVAGPALRWHDAAGAMLGLFRDVSTGEPRAVTRTFLDATGRKLGRKFLGPVGGAAIQFDQLTDELTIAEGVETAMTARVMSMGACWALGSAGAIAAFPVLPTVARLRIVVERDANGASERAALACAERWEAAGREVALKLPPIGLCDLNDIIRGDRL